MYSLLCIQFLRTELYVLRYVFELGILSYICCIMCIMCIQLCVFRETLLKSNQVGMEIDFTLQLMCKDKAAVLLSYIVNSSPRLSTVPLLNSSFLRVVNRLTASSYRICCRLR